MALEECFVYWLWLGASLCTGLFGSWRETDVQRSDSGQGIRIPGAHRARRAIFPNSNFWPGASAKSALTAKHPSLRGVPCPSLSHTKEREEKGRKEEALTTEGKGSRGGEKPRRS